MIRKILKQYKNPFYKYERLLLREDIQTVLALGIGELGFSLVRHFLEEVQFQALKKRWSSVAGF